MNIIESNELIAEFMGWEEQQDPTRRFFGSWISYEGGKMVHGITEVLNFHSSWDWLMPVLKKISSLLFTEYATCESDKWKMIESPTKYSLDSVFKQTVEFIQWYNENKSK